MNGFYAEEKRQRAGRKRRKKKNNNKEGHTVIQNWDDIYDPSRPNSYEEYKHSDEKIREVREWKDRLYAHRDARKAMSNKDSEDEDDYRPQMSSKKICGGFRYMLIRCRPIRATSKLFLCSSTNRPPPSKNRRYPSLRSVQSYPRRRYTTSSTTSRESFASSSSSRAFTCRSNIPCACPLQPSTSPERHPKFRSRTRESIGRRATG